MIGGANPVHRIALQPGLGAPYPEMILSPIAKYPGNGIYGVPKQSIYAHLTCDIAYWKLGPVAATQPSGLFTPIAGAFCGECRASYRNHGYR